MQRRRVGTLSAIVRRLGKERDKEKNGDSRECKGGVFESEARVNEKRKTRGMCVYRLLQSQGSIKQKLLGTTKWER